MLGSYRTKLAMTWSPTSGRNTRPGTNSTAETSLSTSTYAPPVAPFPILGSIAKYRSASVISAQLPYGSSDEGRPPAHPLGHRPPGEHHGIDTLGQGQPTRNPPRGRVQATPSGICVSRDSTRSEHRRPYSDRPRAFCSSRSPDRRTPRTGADPGRRRTDRCSAWPGSIWPRPWPRAPPQPDPGKNVLEKVPTWTTVSGTRDQIEVKRSPAKPSSR